MKNCKKILAMVLAIAVVMSFASVTVSAAGDTTTNLWFLWDADYLSTNDPMTKSSSTSVTIFPDDSAGDAYKEAAGLDMEYLGLAGFSFVNASVVGSTATKVEDPKNAENYALMLDTDTVQSTWRGWFNGGYSYQPTDDSWAENKMGDNNVINFSAKVMIPSTQPKDVIRTVEFPVEHLLYTTTAASYTGVQNRYTLAFDIACEDDKVTVTPKIGGTTSNEGTASLVENSGIIIESVNYDEWFELDFEAYVEDGEPLYFCYYVNDKLCAYYKSGENYTRTVDLEAGTVYALGSGNIRMNTSYNVSTSKSNKTDKRVITYLDEWEAYVSAKDVPDASVAPGPNNVISKELTIEKSGDGLNISGTINNPTYSSADLVIAFYNGNNKLVGGVKKFVITKVDGDFNIDKSLDTIPEGATKVKAFLFDSIVNATPLMKNDTLDLN